jgi:hypothetical protein
MFKLLKLSAIFGAGVVLASGAAHATPVPAGTLTVAVTGSPAVDTGAGTVNFNTSDFYFSGTGAFSGFSGFSSIPTALLSFSEMTGGVVDYSTGSVAGFFTFSGGGDNYSFSLDQSIQTISYSYTPGSNGRGAISLYILGDLTGSGATPYTDPTPTALTLTLNETGGSNWSASATLSNPPPGSGIPPTSITSVPEPASMLLMGTGLAAMGVIRRRRAAR